MLLTFLMNNMMVDGSAVYPVPQPDSRVRHRGGLIERKMGRRELLLKEDEEILLIIEAFVKCRS